MNATRYLGIAASALVQLFSPSSGRAQAEPMRQPVVRLAELDIDPTQLERYKAALREEIETSIRVEPRVLTLFAVSVKDDSTRIRLFEMYADSSAYQAHIASPHFRKYRTGTQAMVKSLRLVETVPVLLGAKRSEILSACVTVR